MFLISNVYAQTGQGPSPTPPHPLMSFLPFVIIFFIFYFLMIRPQKRKLEEEKKFLSSISKGDEIFTKSGLIGTICALTDKIVTLEVEGAKIKVLRSQIGGLAKNIFETKTQEKQRRP